MLDAELLAKMDNEGKNQFIMVSCVVKVTILRSFWCQRDKEREREREKEKNTIFCSITPFPWTLTSFTNLIMNFLQAAIRSLKTTNIKFESRVEVLPQVWSTANQTLSNPTEETSKLMQWLISVTLETMLMVNITSHLQYIRIWNCSPCGKPLFYI